VFKVIVVHIPQPDTISQIFCGKKFVLLIQFLLVLTVTAFHRTVLRGFPGVNEIMLDAQFPAACIYYPSLGVKPSPLGDSS